MDVETLRDQEYQYLKQRQQAEMELKSVVAREDYLIKYLSNVDGAIENCQYWIKKVEEEVSEDAPPPTTEQEI